VITRGLLRREDHRHRFSFHGRRTLDLRKISQLRRHTIDHLSTELGVRDLPPTEHERDLHLVAFFKKTPRMPRLGLKVVIVDPRTVFDLLEMNHVLLLFCYSRLLGLFKFEFPEVHDADNGWPSCSRHFDQVQPLLHCLGQCHVDFHDAELTSVGGDHANGADPDLPVHPWRTLGRILNRPNSREYGNKKRGPPMETAS